MKIGRYDLTYCSNIHAGETWIDVHAAVVHALPRIREQLGVAGAFAIGLRLSAAAARTLDHPETLRSFREFLETGEFYVPTLNGFPYGAFHGTRVKERVYEPDWRTQQRVTYSNQLARIVTALNAHRSPQALSISTVPGAFRSQVRSRVDASAIAAGMLNHAAYLKRLRAETGLTVALAIEPEPACFLETVAEAVAFFREHLLAPETIAQANTSNHAMLTSDDVVRHIGLCLDACHMAVEFEDPADAIALVKREGISIAKVQLSSALRISENGDPAIPRAALRPFAEDVYLHQVVVSDSRGLERFTDLPEALDRRASSSPDAEWRVHFHVPIFLERMVGFETTQHYLTQLLDILERERIETCLEVETYTWDVLPAEYRTTDVCTAIARELSWLRDQLKQ